MGLRNFRGIELRNFRGGGGVERFSRGGGWIEKFSGGGGGGLRNFRGWGDKFSGGVEKF